MESFGSDDGPEVIPVGDVEPFVVLEVQQTIERTFALTLTQRTPVSLPSTGGDRLRESFEVGTLIDAVDQVATPGPTIAVTDADLLAEGRDRIPGVNRLPGSTLVPSTSRLRTADRTLFREWLRKEARHLVAAMFLVDHCAGDPTTWADCVHQYTPSVDHLDRTPETFCEDCEAALSDHLV